MEGNVMKTVVLVACSVALAGCVTEGSYKNATAGRIGCAPENIEISDTHSSFGAKAWKAVCKTDGKVYQCGKGACTEIKQ